MSKKNAKKTENTKGKAPELELPTMAYCRSLEVTPARMFSVMPDGGEQPVSIGAYQGRGTKNYAENENSTKKTTEGTDKTSNLFSSEVAMLALESAQLRVRFGLTVLAQSRRAHTAEKQEVTQKLEDWARDSNNAPLFTELAFLYAQNLASGAWLWRNRDVALQTVVTVVDRLSGESWSFCPHTVLDSLDPHYPKTTDDVLMEGVRQRADLEDQAKQSPAVAATVAKLDALAKIIAAALTDSAKRAALQVSADLILLPGAEVYPSQEMTVDDKAKGRKLYRVRGAYSNEAGMHAAKLGNAIRTIDIWHGERDVVGALAVEPFGGSLRYAKNFRDTTLQYKADSKTNGAYAIAHQVTQGTPEVAVRQEDKLFLLSCLVRGALFTNPSKKAAKTAGAAGDEGTKNEDQGGDDNNGATEA